jgi:hypothetical protein
MFSEVLFSVERIGAMIRELRKTSITMSAPVSASKIPDLIGLPDRDGAEG